MMNLLFVLCGCDKGQNNYEQIRIKEYPYLRMQTTNDAGIMYFILSSNQSVISITTFQTNKVSCNIFKDRPLANIELCGDILTIFAFGKITNMYSMYKVSDTDLMLAQRGIHDNDKMTKEIVQSTNSPNVK